MTIPGKPVRIQRSRAKGWKMPANTVCVDRSSKWGNPFSTKQRRTVEVCVSLHKRLLAGLICVGVSLKGPSIAEQKEYLKFAAANIETLRGKNLACWCPIGKPCHADILLIAANAAPGTCRGCGCTDDKACMTAGQPCHWVEPDLCSACKAKELEAAHG